MPQKFTERYIIVENLHVISVHKKLYVVFDWNTLQRITEQLTRNAPTDGSMRWSRILQNVTIWKRVNTLCCIRTLKERIICCVITSDTALTTFFSVAFNDALKVLNYVQTHPKSCNFTKKTGILFLKRTPNFYSRQ